MIFATPLKRSDGLKILGSGIVTPTSCRFALLAEFWSPSHSENDMNSGTGRSREYATRIGVVAAVRRPGSCDHSTSSECVQVLHSFS